MLTSRTTREKRLYKKQRQPTIGTRGAAQSAMRLWPSFSKRLESMSTARITWDKRLKGASLSKIVRFFCEGIFLSKIFWGWLQLKTVLWSAFVPWKWRDTMQYDREMVAQVLQAPGIDVSIQDNELNGASVSKIVVR